ncbi:TetR/AcrR family transcriptional regulator [Leifsonia sp. SIMBA_070]|uniref:TetR/AcrR family transcriptional regulator n=1 Tax=Leifsonia sp. SIMBA_070 TaxID=3085810 RepID=UPI00397DDEB9
MQFPEPVSRRGRPAKAPLSRRSILDAALALIRERSVDAVTLRDVAAAVNTGPASLYAYFASRDALLEHALDEVYGTVELVEVAAGGWEAALSATIVNTIHALESHPGIGVVALGTVPTLPGALRLAEHELALMEAGGISDEDAALAIDLIAQFAVATAVERTVRHREGRGTSGQENDVLAAYATADPERFPRVRRLAPALTAADEHRRRDFAIQVIISGLTAKRHGRV